MLIFYKDLGELILPFFYVRGLVTEEYFTHFEIIRRDYCYDTGFIIDVNPGDEPILP